MHCANLYPTGANPIVQCVSSGLFILPQKVSMRALAIMHQMATTGPAHPLWRNRLFGYTNSGAHPTAKINIAAPEFTSRNNR
jgi:hypothetical protein